MLQINVNFNFAKETPRSFTLNILREANHILYKVQQAILSKYHNTHHDTCKSMLNSTRALKLETEIELALLYKSKEIRNSGLLNNTVAENHSCREVYFIDDRPSYLTLTPLCPLSQIGDTVPLAS
ncbi:hypothetical protein Ancab_037689 [Ancistrocladus abbreviatus]